MNYYIGIDPGKSGGLALLGDGGCVSVMPMPVTERDVWDWFMDQYTSGDSFFAVIEKVHSMPGQGVVSSFKFGVNYGFLRGCLIAISNLYGASFEEITPQRWQKGLAIPPKKKTESKTEWKNRLKAMAQQLLPKEKVTLAISDALLIAEYCKRKHRGRLRL